MSFQLNCRQLGSIRYRITESSSANKSILQDTTEKQHLPVWKCTFLDSSTTYVYIHSFIQSIHKYIQKCTQILAHARAHSSLHVSYIYKYFINKSTQRGGHPIKNRKPWSNYQMNFLKEKDAVLIYAPQ